jgi:hypothetical protein
LRAFYKYRKARGPLCKKVRTKIYSPFSNGAALALRSVTRAERRRGRAGGFVSLPPLRDAKEQRGGDPHTPACTLNPNSRRHHHRQRDDTPTRTLRSSASERPQNLIPANESELPIDRAVTLMRDRSSSTLFDLVIL